MLIFMLACVGLVGGAAATPAESEATARPNVLFFFADDQRADTVGAWGNEHISTPVIDSLVAKGTSFRQAYCMGSPHGAVCVPSRAMLHTGQPYFRVMQADFAGRPTLGGLLGEAGYTTFGTGKWHNGQPSFLRSFQSGKAVFFGGMGNHHAMNLVDTEGEAVSNARLESRHSSELFADAAVGFLESYEDEAPFFLYAAFTAPHDPRDPPPAIRERDAERRPPLPANWKGQHAFDNGFMTVRDEKLGPWPRTADLLHDQLAEYYGLIEHLDSQIGRVLDALEKSGKAKNTLIVYAADHGLGMGSHGLLGKQSLYEESTRAPVVIVGPGLPVGGETYASTYLFDLFPTLLVRCGVAPPADTFGHDLLPLLAGETDANWPSVFTSMGKTQRALRDGDWKLILYPKVGRTQLFNLASDPLELVNLAQQAEQLNRITWMSLEIANWQARVDDGQSIEMTTPAAPDVDLTGRERKPDRWQPEWIVEKYFGD
ncbi:MAG: arylsulfatase A-like enzyme [Planctomycetota bacterium]|jgi:arylsulfatase A-like enzyme